MNGILIVNKPAGYTSHDIVAKVKKICHEKVGHTGTLDPMATGVLPLLIGEGTKLSGYLTQHDKTYEAVIQLGKQTDTADGEGKVIQEKEVNLQNLEIENVQKVLQSFLGKQTQKPPIYSAIKIHGKKLYEYARNNEKVEIPEKIIEIFHIELVEINTNNQTISFRVHCSKGTYIRTLCEDISKKLDTVGYMKHLKRIQVGGFSIKQAVSLEQIEKEKDNPKFWNQYFITFEKFFSDYPLMILENRKFTLFLNGVLLKEDREDGIYQVRDTSLRYYAIGTIENGQLKRKIVLPN